MWSAHSTPRSSSSRWESERKISDDGNGWCRKMPGGGVSGWVEILGWAGEVRGAAASRNESFAQGIGAATRAERAPHVAAEGLNPGRIPTSDLRGQGGTVAGRCCGARPSPGITGSDAGTHAPPRGSRARRAAARGSGRRARAKGRTDVRVAEFAREVRGDEHEVVVVDPDEVALLVRLDHRLRDRAVHLAVRRPARLLPLHRVPAPRRLPVRRRRPRRRRVPPRHAGQLRLVVGADRRHRRRVVHVDHVVHHRPQRALAEPLVEAVGEARLVVHAHAREAGRRDRLLDRRALGLGHEALRASRRRRAACRACARRSPGTARARTPAARSPHPRRRPPALAVALEVDGEDVGDDDDARVGSGGGGAVMARRESSGAILHGYGSLWPERDEAPDRAVHSSARSRASQSGSRKASPPLL